MALKVGPTEGRGGGGQGEGKKKGTKVRKVAGNKKNQHSHRTPASQCSGGLRGKGGGKKRSKNWKDLGGGQIG